MKFFVWDYDGNIVSKMTWIVRVTDINPDNRMCDFVLLRAAGQFRGDPVFVCKQISSSLFPAHWSKHFDQLFHLNEKPGVVLKIPMVGVTKTFNHEWTYLRTHIRWNQSHRAFYLKIDKSSPVCTQDYMWVTSELETGHLIDLKPPL
jgi:hypothetical protein